MRKNLLSLFLAAGFLVYNNANAWIMTSSSAWVQPIGQQTVADSNMSTAHSESHVATGPVLVSAAADATYGSVKARTAGSSNGGGNLQSGASAGFKDVLILNRDGLYGQTGQISVKYYVDFNQHYVAPSNDISNGSVLFDGLLGATHGYVSEYDRDGYADVPPAYRSEDSRGTLLTRPGGPSWIYVTSDFRWGFALDFGLGVQLQGAAYSPAQDAALGFSIDASHSGYWGGITEVTVNGVKIEDYELTSLSGTDYSKSFAPTAAAVPEPATLGLFAIGVIGAAGVARRRKSVR